MGVTIHYHGSLDDAAQLDAALAMLREECEQRGWPYRELDVEAHGPHETYTFRDVPGPLPGWTDTLTETEIVELDTRWRGLSIDPHPKCESLLMMFDERDARLMLLMSYGGEANSVMYSLSVKTQFAPPEIHVAICEVLHRLQDEFGREKLSVDDESGYFQTQDMTALLEMHGVVEAGMKDLQTLSRIVQLGTIGDRVVPPDESELHERRN
jgi:hypothetical protein